MAERGRERWREIDVRHGCHSRVSRWRLSPRAMAKVRAAGCLLPLASVLSPVWPPTFHPRPGSAIASTKQGGGHLFPPTHTHAFTSLPLTLAKLSIKAVQSDGRSAARSGQAHVHSQRMQDSSELRRETGQEWERTKIRNEKEQR